MSIFARSAAVVTLTLAASSALAARYDWPQWHGPNRDGLTAETGLLKSWPEDGPPREWLFTNAGNGYSGFAVVDDKLYTMGARDGRCYIFALDANTGQELWAVDVAPVLENDWGDGPRSTPTVDGDHLYALTGKGVLVCVRAADGGKVWSVDLQEELNGTEPKWGYCESVLIDGDLVVCTPGGSDGAIAAFDKLNGQLRWRSSELDDGAHYASIQRVELHGQPQYVQLLEKRLIGLDPADGRLLWEAEFPGSVAVIPTPIVRDNKIFATAGYGAGCILVEVSANHEATQLYDERTQKRMKNHHGGVVRVGDHVYGHSDGVGWLCLDFDTGKQMWRERDALGKGAIGYADGMLYLVGEDDGEVVLIDASADGWQERGRFQLDPQTSIRSDRGKIWTHPVIVNGKLYLRDQDHIYCYDVKAD